MARSLEMRAACYVRDRDARLAAHAPAFCQKPAASRPIAPATTPTNKVSWTSLHYAEPNMPNTESTDRDPNAELRSFEPLRVTLALGALLLGLILGIH
jgi:hypothetical protein